MHAIAVGLRMLVGLGLLATIGVAGCTAHSAPSPVASGIKSTPGPAASGNGQPTSSAASSPAVAPSATLTAPGGVRNLIVSGAVRGELTAAYVAVRRISLSDVAGTAPGSVYYAYDPSTDTYWARALFQPSRDVIRDQTPAALTVLVGFQDGGGYGRFKKVGTGPWQVATGGIPFVCADVQFFPRTVLAAWSLPAEIAGVVC